MAKLSDTIKLRYASLEDLPPTPLFKSGASKLFETPWHLHGKPVVDPSKCTRCKLCWLYCPEGVVEVGGEGVVVDYARCKGCGICANECPVKAIRMEVG